MNKRIFSYVCIVLYALLAVSIHCSEQKPSDVRNKIVRSTKEISKCDEKSDIEPKREPQLNNNNNNNPEDDEDEKGFNCFNIFKRNKKNKKNKRTKTPSYSKAPLNHSFKQKPKAYNSNKHLPKEALEMKQALQEFSKQNPNNMHTLTLIKADFEKTTTYKTCK
ncbi:Plasmodium yoelii subtelomeric region (PYST-C1), putative [Plasmodium chabaudi adami]|uniref:Plasmodium yoelii subtelomeric region (PYST-C1), putative n=1 Tax=Plasmodium chabaudi adami TaxID=5826 RepID=A0A1C6W9I9_PLACE|nr:Plasmodium yoelii subtelomeric region (PYST-C1), putative [Plasmodium chabaudi adami]